MEDIMNMTELKAELVEMDNATAKAVWLVFEGDWGGQIYLTVRADLLGEGFSSLPLLAAMNEAAWPNSEQGGCCEHLIRANRNKHVSGGMGGGKLTDGVWIHKEFHIDRWRRRIRQALDIENSIRITH